MPKASWTSAAKAWQLKIAVKSNEVSIRMLKVPIIKVHYKLDQASLADNDGSILVIEKWGIAYERAHKRG
jgi:hypothetical protein